MRVIPFKREHLYELAPMMGLAVSNLSPTVIDQMCSCDCFSGEIDGKIIGCAGILKMWDGVGEAHALLSPELRSKYPLSLHRAVKHGFDVIVKLRAYHRVQCLVEFDFKPGHRWAEALGFKWEGAIPWYTTDKRSFVRYGKLWTAE